MSMFNDHKEVKKGSVPHSVEQRMKLQQKNGMQRQQSTSSNSDTTAMRKMRSDSGFDFDSQIHSNSNVSNISTDPLSPTTPMDAETAAVGRFQVQTKSQSKSTASDSVKSKMK